MQSFLTPAELAQAEKNNYFEGFFVQADTGIFFPIVGITKAGPIVRGPKTGALGRVVRTRNTSNPNGLTRARIEFAVDTATSVGTIEFTGNSVGGYANVRVFDFEVL